MIMPNKCLKQEDTLLGSSAVIFNNLNDKQTLSELWDKVKQEEAIYNFERFILSYEVNYRWTRLILYSHGWMDQTQPG